MTVGAPTRRQQDYLTEYDRMMAKYLRQMGAGIGPQDIAAEAYGGKFPVGTMTAKILSGVLAGASDRRAINRQKQADRAQLDLLEGRATDIQPQLLPNGEFAGGEYMTPEGKFVTQGAPVYQGVGQDADRAAYEARILREQARPGEIAEREYEIRKRNRKMGEEKALFNQFVSDQPNKVSYSNTGLGNGYVGTPKDPLSAVLTGNYRGESIQPLEPLLPIQNQAIERKELYKAETTPGIMVTAEDADASPNWWERKISGDIPGVMVETRNELAQLAGYDPLEWTLAERELAKSGDGIEYSFQNISDSYLMDKDGNSQLTKVGSRTAKDGTIEQFFQNPNTQEWQEMAGSGLTYVPKKDATTQNRAQSAIEGRKITAKKWLENNGYIKDAEDDEFVTAMANAFSGDITKMNPQTGDLYSELPAVYQSLKNIKNTFDTSIITSQEALNVYKVQSPQKAFIIETKVKDLAEDIVKADISSNYVTLNGIQKLLDKYPDDLPGYGVVGSLTPKWFLGEDGAKLKQLFATISNMTLKDRSGAAVTVSELERFKEEIPTFLRNERQLRQGIKTLKEIFDKHLSSIYAIYPENISKIYSTRPNTIGLLSNVKSVDSIYDKYLN